MTASPDLKKSPLHERHVALGAKFAEFCGWEMPLEYAGVVAEHTAVRTSVGVFDVSHLGKATVKGPGAAAYVNACLTNDLGKISAGQAQYTLCCNERGGVVDDLIAYLHADDDVFLHPERGQHRRGGPAAAGRAPEGVVVTNTHDDYAILAVQGLKRRVVAAIGLPTATIHVLRRRPTSRYAGRRVPDRLHGRARVRARRTERRRGRCVRRTAGCR